jgi:replicative DNA helicase
MPLDDDVSDQPHSFPAEQALLGALFANNRLLDRIEYLQPSHFADPLHAEIFTVARSLVEQGRVADPVTLGQRLSSHPDLNRVGGNAYLAKLAGAMVTIVSAEDYASQIFDLSRLRDIMGIGEKMVSDAQLGRTPPSDIIEESETSLFRLAETGQSNTLLNINEVVRQAASDIEEAHSTPDGIIGIRTGLRDIDTRTSGFRSGELVLIAGRPGMGKTCFIGQVAANMVDDGKKVGFFSLEMKAADILKRITSARSDAPLSRIKRGQFRNTDEENRVYDELARWEGRPLYFDEQGGIPLSSLVARARMMKRRDGIDVVVIDHIGLVTPPDTRVSRTHQIEAITNRLKILAKELDIPVIALTQLNRSVDNREDKRPVLADLRDGGSQEQDADTVIFLYRHAYYLQNHPPQSGGRKSSEDYEIEYARWERELNACANVLEVLIRKQRSGETGDVKLFCDLAYMRVKDLIR